MEAIYVKDLTRYPDTTEKLREKAEGVSKNKKTILRTELATYGNTEKALSILKEHASDSSFLFSRDSNGETALYIAAYYGHTEVVKVLIDTVRNLPSAPEPFWKSVTSPSISFIRIANSSRNTALHIAVSNHNVDIVKLLIEADPWDGHIQNNAGDSPVYLAAKRGYNDIVKLICKTCPAASLEGPDKRTALHAAIARLHEGMCFMLRYYFINAIVSLAIQEKLKSPK